MSSSEPSQTPLIDPDGVRALGGSDVAVLCWLEPTPSDLNAQKIAQFLGVAATCVNLTPPDAAAGPAQVLRACGCVVVHADTLVQLASTLRNGADGLPDIVVGEHAQVFVYGFRPSEPHAAVARALSSGGLRGVEALGVSDAEFRVAGGERRWCRHFSGLAWRSAGPPGESRFVAGSLSAPDSALIQVNGEPFFVRLRLGRAELLLSACQELADLDERVAPPLHILQWFSRLAPLMMFLRGALGTRVWHNDRPQACFVIDDPLLNRKRYGFLEYAALRAAVAEQRCAASIAFIPWNHRRSRRDVTSALATASDSISLCVHGCDHTSAEFASHEPDVMRGKAQLALDRMAAHRARFGVPFDDVMVFPQGLFSSAAITALDACGYLAAVNTTVCPVDLKLPLALREWLDVAVTRESDFPVFGRRYPGQLAEFAFDLFLGKPALAVEHHGYFRDGTQAFRRFVTELNGLEPGLEWTSLANVCSTASRRRLAANGDVHLRFYTDRFRVSNRDEQARTYVTWRRWVDRPPPALTVDAERHEWEQRAGDVTFTLSLPPGQTATVRLLPERRMPAGSPLNHGGLRDAGVLARRLLCEFRDNHLDTSATLSRLVAGVRTLLPHARTRTPQSPCAPGS